MAFAKGKETAEVVSIKRYIGVGSVSIVAVNPNKKELESIYNTTLEKEPEYLSKIETGEGETRHQVENAKIDFIVKTDPTDTCNNGIDMITKVTFFIRKEYRFNRDKTKVQVIDKYGRTAWVTIEQAKAKEVPVYSNGPANLDKDYRPCFIGEEELTSFIKTYLGIGNVMKYVNGTWIMRENSADYESRLDKINEYFKGNFKEIADIINLQPNNKIKVLFGVRNTDDGKQYQTAYTQMFIYATSKEYSKLAADLEERKANGAFSSTEFEVCDIKEYAVNSTSFTANTSNESDLPFDNEPKSPFDPF